MKRKRKSTDVCTTSEVVVCVSGWSKGGGGEEERGLRSRSARGVVLGGMDVTWKGRCKRAGQGCKNLREQTSGQAARACTRHSRGTSLFCGLRLEDSCMYNACRPAGQRPTCPSIPSS